MSMTIFQKREKRKRAVYSAASSMLIHLSLAISDIFSPPDGLCITIQPSDKLQFVGSFTLCSIFHPLNAKGVNSIKITHAIQHTL